MMDTRLCEWLMDNADASVRYRVAREFLKDNKAARKTEAELPENPAVKIWLKNLKYDAASKRRWIVHGSFDYCFENAMLKIAQLGLHAKLPQVKDALSYYINFFKSNPVVKSYRALDLLITTITQAQK